MGASDDAMKNLNDAEKEFFEMFKPKFEKITSAEKFDFDGVSDIVDELGESEVRMLMKFLGMQFNGTDDMWDLDDARDHCVKQIIVLARQAHDQRFKQANRKDKMEYAIKKKPIQQLKDMLEDCELPFD